MPLITVEDLRTAANVTFAMGMFGAVEVDLYVDEDGKWLIAITAEEGSFK